MHSPHNPCQLSAFLVCLQHLDKVSSKPCCRWALPQRQSWRTRKLRIEDAKNATFAAVEEGIVPGGGAALLHLSEFVPEFRDTLTNTEEKLGADIVFKSLTVSLAHNACLPVAAHTGV